MRASVRGGRGSLLLLAGALLAAPAPDTSAKQGKRFGIEGHILDYDEAREVVNVKVIATKVEGRSLSGNTVGGKAPNDIKRLKTYEFAVEPEGSVLRRTVIRAETGAGLDTSGTREGFKKALARVPDDRPVVMSLEANDPAAVKAGAPPYKVLLVQIQYTMEELIERWERISEEVD